MTRRSCGTTTATSPPCRKTSRNAPKSRTCRAFRCGNLLDGGFEPDSVVDAVSSGDWKRLSHTGKLSVQLQEPGAESSNGAGQLVMPDA